MFPLCDSTRRRGTPWMTLGLIGLNVAVFVFQLLLIQSGLGERALQQWFMMFGVVPARFAQGDWLWGGVTLVTSMFLHGGWLHILSNLWTLWIFGDNVEERMGHGRFLVFYLVAGIAGGVAQVVLNWGSVVPGVGASGAIAGVLGAYLLLFPRAQVDLLIPIFIFPWVVTVPAVLYLGFWGLMQFFSGVLSLGVVTAGGIAYWAHVGGFVAGLVLVGLFARRVQRVLVERWDPLYGVVYEWVEV